MTKPEGIFKFLGLKRGKEAAMNKSEGIFKGGWLQVNIYAPTYALPYVCTGHVYCLPGRRLLDQLNDVFPGTASEAKEFLSVTGGEMYALRGEKKTVEFACLNKANILFVRESEDGQARGFGGNPGHMRYPYVKKSPVAVKLYLPFYVLTGHMHCAEGQRVSDVVNLPLRFFPITDVEINPSVGISESGVSFIAVNKSQIILLEEVKLEKTDEGQ